MQYGPAGGAAAGPQRSGGGAGAAGGDGVAQAESGRSLTRQTPAERPHHRGGPPQASHTALSHPLS